MEKIVSFKSFDCPYCKKHTPLPVRIHYKNMGMVLTWCEKCGKEVYINKQKIVKKY